MFSLKENSITFIYMHSDENQQIKIRIFEKIDMKNVKMFI